jgi:transposase InsO family protein
MLTREWFTAAEIAAMRLPGCPTRRPTVTDVLQQQWGAEQFKDVRWRGRAGRGGGVEYHYTALSAPAQAQIVATFNEVAATGERARARDKLAREDLWTWFDGLPAKKKAEAERKLEALDAARAMTSARIGRTEAMRIVAQARGIAVSSLYAWEQAVACVPRHDWLPYLAPRHAGRVGHEAECSAEAWEFLKADFLRLERPTFESCFRRLERAAKEHGWTIPSERTLQRRMDALPEELRILTREGMEALKRSFPAQERDRGVFHALEAVNADGHRWDVFVRWPDGMIGRPMMCAFQDLFSGMVLSWRVDRTANKEAVRLAFGDMVEAWGIPDLCWLDNGRDFASKWLTGGTPNRYRFKVKDDEPAGVMTQMGVQVHWTTPYHGQSKPIERAFRDMAGDIAKHPRFAGAWTGNNPMAKPENYASKAVPLDVFLATLAEEITAHNERVGRRTRACGGTLSFRAAFDASYAVAPIRKAAPEQRRLWLMAAEAITVRQQDGSVHLEGNRYWCQHLLALRGQKVTVRFDPQAMHAGVHIYRMDGAYLAHAPCIEAVGFADADAAREHAQKLGRFTKATKELAKAERSLSIAEVAALLPAPATPAPPPETKLVRLVRGNTALAPAPAERTDAQVQVDDLFLKAVRMQRAARLHLVEDAEGDG